MNNEEKLLKLLQVATDNGWEDKDDLVGAFESAYYQLLDKQCLIYHDNHDVDVTHSINDLVLNWEEGEVSFIEALIKASINNNRVWNQEMYYLASEIDDDCNEYTNTEPISREDEIRIYWILQPTCKRLDWLIETFEHLLT